MNFLSYLGMLLIAAMPPALLAGGLYFGFRLRFFPFLHPCRTGRVLLRGGQDGVRPMLLALGGTVGVGNITGVALAIGTGGPGAVFWMWLCAFAAMLLKYAEITLAMAYHARGAEGGTPYVMQKAGLPRLGRIFAWLCIGYTLLVGGAVQANAVSTCLCDVFSFSPLWSGLLLLVLALPVMLGGAKRISAFTAWLVPFMCIGYMGATLAIIFFHREALPQALCRIGQDALSPAAAAGGGLGFLCSRALRVGAARGLMSNEGGCGTAPMAHVTGRENLPARQGLFGILEVFIDTTVICTLTALALLTALPTLPDGAEGIALVRLAFATVFGEAGGALLAILLFFFAYATLLCQAFYGRVCLLSLHAPRRALPFFYILFSLALLWGAVGAPGVVWQACDLLLAVMTLCNLALLWRKRELIVTLTREAGLLPPMEKDRTVKTA